MSPHGHPDETESVRRRTRSYLLVFAALMVLTLLTVGVAYLHMPPALAVGVALAIALLKGSLVAGVFMHLFAERRVIHWMLALTAVLFLVLLVYPALSEWERMR